MDDTIEIQSKYYQDTASQYDTMHMHEEVDPEHEIAFYFMCAMIEKFNFKSVLDIGAGTGRVILQLQKKYPWLRVEGIEPVEGLREQGYKKGVLKNDLFDGDGKNINFPDNQYDLVCAFGVLHHIDKPELVVREMLRVSKYAIFISDANNFGQGSRMERLVKQTINALGLWDTYNYIRTKGKKYQISEGDGLFYSYSIFSNLSLIKKNCKTVHLISTRDAGMNLYRTASHAAIFGLK
jgi:ubiquinone/menaquinone biosynthesis C-methylase UbiE